MASHQWRTSAEMRRRYAKAGHSCPRYLGWMCQHCGQAQGKEGDPTPPDAGCLELRGDAMPS